MAVIIGGHRGDGRTDNPQLLPADIAQKAAENTLDSMRDALRKGPGLLEVDVVQSGPDEEGNGAAIVIHSNDLREHVLTASARACLKPGCNYVNQYSPAELQLLRVGPDGKGVILTLTELLELVCEPEHRNVILNIELKGLQSTPLYPAPATGRRSLVDTVMMAIEQSAIAHSRIILSSFSAALLQQSRDQAPHIRRGLLLTSPQDTVFKTPVGAFYGDHSLYEGVEERELERFYQSLELSYIHPELTTVSEPLIAWASGKRGPDGLPVGLNLWSHHEQNPYLQKDRIQEIMRSAEKYAVPLCFITDYITAMQEVVALP